MDQPQNGGLDQAAFQRVWQRVMPEPRPDCPFTLEPPPAPAVPVPAPSAAPQPPPVCLGEGSVGDLPTLQALLTQTAEGARVYRELARQWRREPLLHTLAEEKRRHVKRLSAAHFLIAGERYFPVAERSEPLLPPLALRLRERFQAEQRLALAFFQAANAATDPCLIELYRELGKRCQEMAGALRTWMENQ